MNYIDFNTKSVSEITYGMWRINDSTMNCEALESFLLELLELGINTIDTAAIYGDYFHHAESYLKQVFMKNPTLCERFNIITKAGIVSSTDDSIAHYDNTFDYIVMSAKDSIEAMGIKKIDIFLIHRPDMLCDFSEIYRSFKYLSDQGLVDEFGVSNFSPIEFDALNKYLKKRGISLVTNQIEVNNFTMEHYNNDNLFYLKGEEISPMIWSPMGGGRVFLDDDIALQVESLALKYNVTRSQIVISFLHNQGLNPVTIIGSNKIENFKQIVEGLKIKLSQHDMYVLIKSCTKCDVK